MKYITLSIMLYTTTLLNAQVAIGKESVNGTSTLLDFYDKSDNYRGIIIPAIDNQPNSINSSNNGTFILDKSDKKVKMYENNTWKDLSPGGDITSLKINSSDENNQNQGVIIDANNSSAKGVLVLESSNKAIILPKVANPHTTIKSPYPGMICYDTVGKALAVFDGKVWSFWR